MPKDKMTSRERVLAALGTQPIRHEVWTSLSSACARIMRDSRCDARMRDLLREHLLGSE